MKGRKRFKTLAVLVALAFAVAPGARAAVKDALSFAGGGRISDVTVLRESYDAVEIDRDGDGVGDERFDPETITSIVYGDAPVDYRLGAVSLKTGRLADAAKKMEKALKRSAKKKFGSTTSARARKYIYGTLQKKTSWKPGRKGKSSKRK